MDRQTDKTRKCQKITSLNSLLANPCFCRPNPLRWKVPYYELIFHNYGQLDSPSPFGLKWLVPLGIKVVDKYLVALLGHIDMHKVEVLFVLNLD